MDAYARWLAGDAGAEVISISDRRAFPTRA